MEKLYKFDPMDFETKQKKEYPKMKKMYKFDPMDFETSHSSAVSSTA